MSTHQTIDLNGRTVSYRVRRSHRAKHLGLRISPVDGLVVVLPRRCDPQQVEPLLRRKAGWILKHMERFACDSDGNGSRKLADGDTIFLQGESVTVRVSNRQDGGRSTIRFDDGHIEIRLCPADAEYARLVLEAGMRARARHIIHHEAARLACAHGLSFNRVFIRDQKTRWGSCSSNGNLNFNWRLIMAPPKVLRYVVAHEMAHLKVKNHSPEFWQQVAALCPEYKESRQWQRENGHQLLNSL